MMLHPEAMPSLSVGPVYFTDKQLWCTSRRHRRLFGRAPATSSPRRPLGRSAGGDAERASVESLHPAGNCREGPLTLSISHLCLKVKLDMLILTFLVVGITDE